MLIGLRNSILGKRLPYDAEVTYLESTGTQWIDTGINADSNLGFDLTFALTSTTPNQRFGALYQLQSGYIRHHFNLSDGKLSYYLADDQQLATRVNQTLDIQTWAYNSTTQTFNINGISGVATSRDAFDCNLSYWLFKRNSNV